MSAVREKSFKIKSEGKISEAVQFKQNRGYKMGGGKKFGRGASQK